MKHYKEIGIISIILILAGLICSLLRVYMPSKYALTSVKIFVGMMTLIFAIYYTTFGYKKNGELFYKIFMCFFALNGVLATLLLVGTLASAGASEIVVIILNAAWCIMAFILTFGKDLGRRKSLTYGALTVVLNIIICIYVPLTADTPLSGFLSSFQTLIIALLALIFIYAKFEDKKARKGSYD